MRSFVHHDVEQLGGLLRELTDVFRLYNERGPEVNVALLALLDTTAKTYRERGRENRETHVESLKAEITTALRGIHPVTLEKVAVRRHEMQSAVAFKILQALETQLQGDLQEAVEALDGAERLVAQILVAAFQKTLIGDADVLAAVTQEAVDALWRAIGADPEIALAQKRALLMVSIFDVQLLVDKLLAGLRQSMAA